MIPKFNQRYVGNYDEDECHVTGVDTTGPMGTVVHFDCFYCGKFQESRQWLLKNWQAVYVREVIATSDNNPTSVSSLDAVTSTGAVRSNDGDMLDPTSLPPLAMLGLARVAKEGHKYGRFNFYRGMPAHECVRHSYNHMLRWLAGDRTEPHLLKAAWGFLVAEESMLVHPELSKAHLIGPGATMPPEMIAYLDSQAPILEAKRKAGEFDELADWSLGGIDEVKKILAQRAEVSS